MGDITKPTTDKHPIQVVSRRTGLSQDVLRVWEKRYRAVMPSRSPTGRRLYTTRDIERVLLLRQATQGGRRIGQVAHLSDADLEGVVQDDREAETRINRLGRVPTYKRALAKESESARSAESEFGFHLDACIQAVQQLDGARLESELFRAEIALGRLSLIEKVLVSLMNRIGDLWQDRRFEVVHEHMASSVVRAFLGNLRDAYPPPAGAPHLICATPSGYLHEFGALLAAAAGASAGWRTTYLGANLPAAEILLAAEKMGAHAVALSAVFPLSHPELPNEIETIRCQLPRETHLIVGGRAAEKHRERLETGGTIVIHQIEEFRALIGKLSG